MEKPEKKWKNIPIWADDMYSFVTTDVSENFGLALRM